MSRTIPIYLTMRDKTTSSAYKKTTFSWIHDAPLRPECTFDFLKTKNKTTAHSGHLLGGRGLYTENSVAGLTHYGAS